MKITVNTDENHVAKIRQKLKEKDNHCPCAIVMSDDTLCPCKEFRESEKLGYCHCGLWNKVEL